MKSDSKTQPHHAPAAAATRRARAPSWLVAGLLGTVVALGSCGERADRIEREGEREQAVAGEPDDDAFELGLLEGSPEQREGAMEMLEEVEEHWGSDVSGALSELLNGSADASSLHRVGFTEIGPDSPRAEGANKARSGEECDGDDCCPDGSIIFRGTEGRDLMLNFHPDVCILGLGGNDFILDLSCNGNGTVLAGADNDFVLTRSATRVGGGAGDDLIIATGRASGIQIGGDAGDDRVLVSSRVSEAHVSGNAGKDRIVTFGEDATVIGGPGRDRIELFGEDSTAIIYDLCEVESGELYLAFCAGNDTLITPVDVATLEGMGVTVDDFEEVVVAKGQGYLSECNDAQCDCRHGQCTADEDHLLRCVCATGWSGDLCDLCNPDEAPECPEATVEVEVLSTHPSVWMDDSSGAIIFSNGKNRRDLGVWTPHVVRAVNVKSGDLQVGVDNLIWVLQPGGRMRLTNCDEQGACAGGPPAPCIPINTVTSSSSASGCPDDTVPIPPTGVPEWFSIQTCWTECNECETCLGGICYPAGNYEPCHDDGDPCTADECRMWGGPHCVHEPIEACEIPECEPGAEYCVCAEGGVCYGTGGAGNQLICTDAGACVDPCITEIPGSAWCTDADDNECTAGYCAGTECTPFVRADGISCQVDGQAGTCVGGECLVSGGGGGPGTGELIHEYYPASGLASAPIPEAELELVAVPGAQPPNGVPVYRLARTIGSVRLPPDGERSACSEVPESFPDRTNALFHAAGGWDQEPDENGVLRKAKRWEGSEESRGDGTVFYRGGSMTFDTDHFVRIETPGFEDAAMMATLVRAGLHHLGGGGLIVPNGDQIIWEHCDKDTQSLRKRNCVDIGLVRSGHLAEAKVQTNCAGGASCPWNQIWEVDITFDSGATWSETMSYQEALQVESYSLSVVARHEFGHFYGLNDLENVDCQDTMMYTDQNSEADKWFDDTGTRSRAISRLGILYPAPGLQLPDTPWYCSMRIDNKEPDCSQP